MKKIVLISIVTLFVCKQGYSQTVNDVPIKDIDVDYIQIIGTSRELSNKLTIKVDFGQENKLFSSGKDTKIKDANGKNMIFNSMIDALNFMTKNGYEFVQAYSSGDSNQYACHYLLKRK